MKKYLMTGIAAVAMCAAFTSCSHDVEPVSQEDLNKFEAQKIVENYNQAFIRTFGQPAANQTWGFGTATRGITRANGAINVNGNEWTECPGVRVENDEEVNAIFNYVKNGTEWMTQNNKPFSTTAPQNLNGYFVTQVRSGNNNYADNKYRLEYYNQGTEYIENVGAKMDHLQIAFNQNPSMADLNAATSHDNISGWQHINNFNASANINWGNPQSAANGNTKVEEKGAFDFAYHNSLDQQYHNKWILVDGANISSDPYYADFYYVCFDYESDPANNPSLGNKTYISCEKKMANGSYQGGWNVELDGTYWTAEEVATKLTSLTIDGQSVPMSDIRNIKIERYSQGDKMVKGDNKYTDWIIRITKGEPEIVNPDDVCIIAEDLSADDASDFDFNDVVFTVHYKTETTADITLYAAGGTLPLKVAGREVHAEFGYAQPDPTTGLYKMINTGAKANVNNVNTVSFEVSGINKSNRGNDIVILVNKGKKNDQGVFVDNWIELKANAGEPAAKLCVGVDYATDAKWCDERENISGKYPPFTQWVTSDPTIIWWK